MRLRATVVALVLLVAGVPNVASARAVEIEGTKCAKAGQKRLVKKTPFVCTKTAKGSFWFSSGTPSRTAVGGSTTTTVQSTTTTVQSATSLTSQAEIPSIIQNWGFNLAPYSASTGYAGDMKIRGVVPPTFGGENAARDNAQYRLLIDSIALQTVLGKASPQISFWLPLETKVVSMITGTVCKVEKLYSGDFTVMIASQKFPCVNGQSLVSFEHEHVINPVVTVGQRVTAGDVLATVSDYNPHWKAKGLGVVEIGILFSKKNSNQAWHACVSSFLDPARKSAMVQAMESAMAAWESELSDPTVFDERAMPIAGCYTTEEIPA
ncbi:MAG: hypothetical protein RL574_52 [Actinomycetota bacterium]|nr:hypothetical protein [Actinomycetota bacterium]NDD18642.1 hypothetical protein [Acidimicrobiia bacterium]NDA54596.1 hypothetical protein [Actinomycetota bacterium]NDE52849.1 hypothetical protein [Actinomycetota bacterium]NDF69141.1 hypothetical protein [Actinomycetota bacterium]